MFIMKHVFVWRPHPLLYASSSIFALSSALISALISSKLTEGLAGSLSCSDALFPLHCFRLEKNSQPWTPTHDNTVALSQNGQRQLWLSGGVYYRHPRRHDKYEQKKRSWHFATLLGLFSSPHRTSRSDTWELRSLYNQIWLEPCAWTLSNPCTNV